MRCAPPGTRSPSSRTTWPASTPTSPRWAWSSTSLAQAVRPRGWHTILRAAYPDADGLRPRNTMAAYLAGAGLNGVIPARGGDVVKLWLVHRRIEGARYPTLAATFVPETVFETLFGCALVAWALARGFLPVPGTSGDLPQVDVSLFLEHPVLATLTTGAASWRWACSRSAWRGAGCRTSPRACARAWSSSAARGSSSPGSPAGRRSRASSAWPRWRPSCRPSRSR